MHCGCSPEQWRAASTRGCRPSGGSVHARVRYVCKSGTYLIDLLESAESTEYSTFCFRWYQASRNGWWKALMKTLCTSANWCVTFSIVNLAGPDLETDTKRFCQCEGRWYQELERCNSRLDHTTRSALEPPVGSQHEDGSRILPQTYWSLVMPHWLGLDQHRVRPLNSQLIMSDILQD